jgi:tetratricopeptide (TPR) repeat protein/cell division septation protein DedD
VISMNESKRLRCHRLRPLTLRHGLIWGTLLLAIGLAAPARAAENWFENGLAELKVGNYQAAVNAFSLAIESVPHDFEALNNRGFARIYTGDYEGAVADCTRAIEINPGSAKAYNNRGFARLFIDAHDLAIEDFNQALVINPRYVDAYSNRCLAWIRKEKYTLAIEDCAEALAINPRSAKALYNRGFARDRQGDAAGALDDYIQALAVNPNYVEVYNNIAWILATATAPQLRDGRRAVIFAEKAAASTPDPNILDTLAAAYAEAGRFDEAVALENRIVSLMDAEGRHAPGIAAHVARLNLYEEGRPYRDPAYRQTAGDSRLLETRLAKLERRLTEPLVPVDYQPDQAPPAEGAARRNQTPASAVLLAQNETSAPVAAPPAARDQTLHTPLDTPLEITLETETPQPDRVLYDIETVPFNGTLHGTLPHLLYTPRNGFSGTDRFTFRARNEAGNSNLATIVILVGAAPESPTSASTPAEVAPTAAAPQMQPAEAAPAAADGASTPAAPGPAEPPRGSEVQAPDEATAADTMPGDASPAPPAASAEAAALQPTTVEGLPPDSAYTIQVRSAKTAAGAAKLVAQFRKDGFTAFSQAVEVGDRGIWHRVFVNGYASKQEAQTALAALDATRFKDAFVRPLPAGLAGTPAENAPAMPSPPTESDTAAVASSAAATAAPSAPSPPAVNYPYAYQVKSYREKSQAYQLGLELTSQGYTAFLGASQLGSTGYWQRVYVGCFRTPEEAEALRQDLIRDGFADAFLTYLEFGIAVTAADSDPQGEELENRLLAAGFLPYRLPRPEGGKAPVVMVGGYHQQEEARAALEALGAAGFMGRLVAR